jgi:tetratricopeptide (TPR) repeat protein
MLPTPLCIVARYMSRSDERVHIDDRIVRVSRVASVLSVVLVSCVLLGGASGCEEIDGHYRTRTGNRLFRDTRFIDAAAEYQLALTKIDHPNIHYNLGLAYSKIFKPGYSAPIPLGTKNEAVCQAIPGTAMIETGVCVKEGDRHFAECGSKKTQPIESEIAKLKSDLNDAKEDDKKKELQSEIKDKENEIGRYTCPSSFTCVESTFCSLTSPQIAELAAQHFQVWIKAQPGDDEIKKQVAEKTPAFDEAKKGEDKDRIAALQKELDELQTKDQTRKLMTSLWLESEQYDKALAYWESLLKDRPNDPEIMGPLAGINLKAGDWRKSIEWYNKIAVVTADVNSKIAAYQFIGNVAWSKLNSRSLIGAEAIELADRGIAALQRASEAQPSNFRVVSLRGAIFNFRSTAHGASWAAAIDRASAQDQAKLARVLAEEAKKTQPNPVAPAPGASTPSSPPGPGSAAGSAGAPAPAGSAAAPAAGSAAPAAPSAPATPSTGAPAAAPARAPAAPAPEAPASGSSAPSTPAPTTPATPAEPPPATGSAAAASGG